MPAPAPKAFAKYLLQGEEVLLQVTYHWMVLAKPGLRLAAAVVVGPVLVVVSGGAGLAWVILVLALGGFGLPVLAAMEERVSVRFIVTEDRFLFVTGWLAKRYGMMPLTAVTDLVIEEPILGRIFGYGTLVAESAGQEQAFNRIPYLPDPQRVWHTISNLLYVRGAARSGYRSPLTKPAWEGRELDLVAEPTNPLQDPPGSP